ncbi:MAG TPA: SH3 domain-containing protein [Pyrinomonadaceae bacterium]|nr:SH3 domain-containing protein [Pyrinomonadaceae bacterium]HMP65797.1 SH3 domain-containing protein [Pyrinomonadaceae bacterium]
MKGLSVAAIVLIAAVLAAEAQRRPARTQARPAAQAAAREARQTAIVMDESLSVLRDRPSLFGNAVQRMRRGRRVQIIGSTEADGVRFLRVSAPPSTTGWVQADAVFLRSSGADEERFVRLVTAADGFSQIDLAIHFLNFYTTSEHRPSILLLLGDLLEDTATRLTREANNRLNRREMAATAAPLHSYYLNYVSLDRYRRIGIRFLFNPETRSYHYDGAAWMELTRNHAGTKEAEEAAKRLDELQQKMERTGES